MYVPDWLVFALGVGAFYFYWKNRKSSSGFNSEKGQTSIEGVERNVRFMKDRIFSLEHFDSPHFVDCQDAFDAMQINYFRLKQRFSHSPEKVLEIAKDWHRYVEALEELKQGRVMLDIDMDAWERDEDERAEYSIIKDEVEKKFKPLLEKDWQEIPPDYFKRMETMKKPDEKTKNNLGLRNEWRWYYGDSANAFRLFELREKEKKEAEAAKKGEG